MPRSATLATLYHPSVLAPPFFPNFHIEAKVDFLHSISTSNDPYSNNFLRNSQNLPNSVSSPSFDLLQAAKASIADLPPHGPQPSAKESC